jgi:hypothetical protein
MAQITRGTKSGTGTTAFGASTSAKASEVNTDFDTVYAAVNNLDNTNIATGADIDASKVDLSLITQNVTFSNGIVLTGGLTQTGNLTVGGILTITGYLTGGTLTTGALICSSLKLTSAQVLPVTAILDEDNMVSNTTAALCTQQSIKAYVDTAVASSTSDGAWTDYSATSTIVGFSAFTNKYVLYKKLGRTVFCSYWLEGTSDSTETSFTLAHTSSATTGTRTTNVIFDALDSGSAAAGALIFMGSNSNKVYCYKTAAGAAWTASGDKRVSGSLWFEAAS